MRGIHTVEAAFIVLITLTLIQSLIFLALTLHDRAAAYELAQRYLSACQDPEQETEEDFRLLESGFLEEAGKAMFYAKIDSVTLRKSGLKSEIRYTIGGEEKVIRAGMRVSPLTVLRAVRGVTGREE